MDDAIVLVYATFPDVASARETGGALVEARLCACVNILPGMTSIYRWQDDIESASEVVLIAKTRKVLGEALVKALVERHPYDVPAALIVPVGGGNPDFCAWIRDETAGKGG